MPRRLLPSIALLLLVVAGQSQSQPPQSANLPLGLIRSVRVIPTPDGPAVEVIGTRPLTPAILTLREPARLVVDLRDTIAPTLRKVDFRSDQVSQVRVNQFQKDPPVTRIVIDLVKPVTYTWDAAGNRLMIRLYRAPETQQNVAEMPAPPQAAGAPAAVVPVATGAGTVVQTSTQPGTNSTLTAGAETATLRLPKGGEVRVCPGTTVSVTYSKNGRDLMLGMNTGAIEADYSLQTSADSVMTPDFRILLAGPGDFHYAISADSRGNTCVRSLPGNTASAIVSELMGDGTYQVKSAEQVVFHGGLISTRDKAVPADCGCPPEAERVLRTAAVPAASSPSSGGSGGPSGSAPQVLSSGPETAALPAPSPNQVHVQVDAPFVFRAGDEQDKDGPVFATREPLRLNYLRLPAPLEVTVLPPPEPVAAKPKHTGFFGKLGGFFAAIFR